MKISEIIPNMRIETLEACVKEINQIKEFSKFGRIGKVATVILSDDTGEISLTLWDEQVELLEKGDKVILENAFAKEWKGVLQISIGREGSIVITKQ